MKTRKIISTAIILVFLTTGCTQPVNLSFWLKPVKQSLQEVFAILAPQTSQTEKSAKSEEIEAAYTELPVELLAADTPEVVQVTTPTAQESGATDSLPEPAGKVIYTCQVDNTSGHDQICMVNTDGTGFTQLTADLLHQHLYASWAPDGKSFVFSGSHSGTFKIYEMDLEGNMTMVGDISGELYAPVISPDGTRIAFTRHLSEKEHYISVMDRDGGNVVNLTNYYDAQDPVWSPDGSRILFSSLQDGSQQLYYMDADGRNIQKVEELSGLRGRADWSLDLDIVTYSGEKDNKDRAIILFELGTEPVILTQGGDNLSPSFSPDGQWITFMSYRDHFWESDGCEIYIMRKDGTDIRRLTDNTYCDYQPRWSK